MINDAPIVSTSNSTEESAWRPENYSHKFYGPTSIRTALRKSRNLIAIRLTRALGIATIADTAIRFGFLQEQLPAKLSLALGSGYASPLQMARMYAVFANGGYLINPYYIERIEASTGETIFQAEPLTGCSVCVSNTAPRIISPQINFLMNSLLRDVVQRGTAVKAKSLQRTDLAGKTGTTNDQKDAWFNGFTPDVVGIAWVGRDDSRSLGRWETGGKAALPMWIDFMRYALKDKVEKESIMPEGISKVLIDPETGLLAREGSSTGIWEYFSDESVPTEYAPLIGLESEIAGEKTITEDEVPEALF
jgi:penicillin-binding protein 1A